MDAGRGPCCPPPARTLPVLGEAEADGHSHCALAVTFSLSSDKPVHDLAAYADFMQTANANEQCRHRQLLVVGRMPTRLTPESKTSRWVQSRTSPSIQRGSAASRARSPWYHLSCSRIGCVRLVGLFAFEDDREDELTRVGAAAVPVRRIGSWKPSTRARQSAKPAARGRVPFPPASSAAPFSVIWTARPQHLALRLG